MHTNLTLHAKSICAAAFPLNQNVHKCITIRAEIFIFSIKLKVCLGTNTKGCEKELADSCSRHAQHQVFQQSGMLVILSDCPYLQNQASHLYSHTQSKLAAENTVHRTVGKVVIFVTKFQDINEK